MNLSKIKNNKGITLISLVVTIIVLIIISGIGISAVVSENGMISITKEKKEKQEQTEILQELELQALDLQRGQVTIDENDEMDLQKYIDYIKGKEFNGYKITYASEIIEDESGEYIEIVVNNKYLYTTSKIDDYIIINFKGKVDELPPEIKKIETETTTNTIKIIVDAIYADEYKFIIKGQAEDGTQIIKESNKINEREYKFEQVKNLENGYTLEVIAINDNGEDTKYKYINTEPMPEPNFDFDYDPTTWTNKTVTVTASTQVAEHVLKTSKDGVTWEQTPTQTFETNGTLYAMLTDGTNITSIVIDITTFNVTNIDKSKPTIGSVTGSTVKGNTGTVTVNTIADTGGSGLAGIYISTSNTTPAENATGWIECTAATYTKTVTTNGKYYVWVKDIAGNISNVETCEVTGIVSKVTITAFNNISLLRGNTGTPTLTYTGTAKSIAYSSSDTTKATINATNGLVTANDTNTGTSTLTVKITNYDGTTVTKTAIATVSSGKARVNDKKDFATLASAVSATTSGTIKMLANTTESVTIAAGKSITLALNTYTVTGSITNNGTLTVSGGTLTASGVNAILNKGTLTSSANITVPSGVKSPIRSESGTVNISGGTISYTGSNNVHAINIVGGTVNISGGTVTIPSTTSSSYVVLVQAGTLNVSGGTLSGSGTGATVRLAGAGKANITGGTITASGTNTAAINNASDATGTLVITAQNGNTQITSQNGRCIYLGSTKGGLLTIGVSGDTNDTYPLITSNATSTYNVVVLSSDSLTFKMYSGRLRAKGNSDVYKGTNSVTSKSGYTWTYQYYSSTTYHTYRWKAN